jgi:polyhydroxybutyrate depolymerase
MKQRLRPLRLVLLTLLIGPHLNVTAQPTEASGHEASTATPDSVHRVYTLMHEDRQRRYEVQLPTPTPTEPMPLILAIHGATDSLETYRKVANLEPLAKREGIIVVYPVGTPLGNILLWNAGACCLPGLHDRPNDVDFLLRVLADVEQRFPVDRTRVYAVGMSNGAMMTYRLATEAPAQFAAVATVAGPMALRQFHPKAPISIMHIQSKDDPILPFAGRRLPPIPLPSGQKTVQRWVDYAHCPDKPVIETVRHAPPDEPAAWQATRERWSPCAGDTEIVLWQLEGAGHVWPGGYQPPRVRQLMGGEYHVIDASQEIWQFFQRHRLATIPAQGGS